MIISRMVDSLWLSNEVSAEQQFNGVLSILTTTQVAQVGRFLSCLSTSLFAFIVSFALLRLQNLLTVGVPEGFLWRVSIERKYCVWLLYWQLLWIILSMICSVMLYRAASKNLMMPSHLCFNGYFTWHLTYDPTPLPPLPPYPDMIGLVVFFGFFVLNFSKKELILFINNFVCI